MLIRIVYDGGSVGVDSDDDENSEVHKRGSQAGSDMDGSALYLRGLRQRRKDAKHMIHTIESLMHIGK